MTVSQTLKKPATPAWISAVAAVLVGLVAVWSLASSPSQAKLQDHEKRLRTLEQITAQQLSSIDARLANLEHSRWRSQ